MPQSSSPLQPLEEPPISFYWSDKGLGTQPDNYPRRFFAGEGFHPAQVHKVGRKSEARCDVRVNGLIAELNYEPYAEFNRANGMLLGVTRLTFVDKTRTKILSAEWKPKDKPAFEPPVTNSRPIVPFESRLGVTRNYYRLMLGRKSIHAAECFAGGFVGTDFGIEEDLSQKLGEDWRDFNRRYIPVYMAMYPEKTKVGAGLACGFLWTVSKGIKIGDIVLSPDGTGRYRVGEITGDYYYAPGQVLFHRRPARWTDTYIVRDDMSEGLRNSSGSIGTVCDLSRAGHQEELDKFIGATAAPALVASDKTVEDPTVFALEKHLQEFLVHNWEHTDLGKRYEIYRDENSDGQQVKADDGYIDILAVRKDKGELLVVELKKGRASDAVVGQIQRYMGYVLDELAKPDQKVRGVIIALEDDKRIRRALRVAQNIEFYRYEVSFKLFKA